MFGGNGVSTLFYPNVKLTKNKGDSVFQLDYCRVIGCLMYMINCTRPDIAYAVSKLSSIQAVLALRTRQLLSGYLNT